MRRGELSSDEGRDMVDQLVSPQPRRGAVGPEEGRLLAAGRASRPGSGHAPGGGGPRVARSATGAPPSLCSRRAPDGCRAGRPRGDGLGELARPRQPSIQASEVEARSASRHGAAPRPPHPHPQSRADARDLRGRVPARVRLLLRAAPLLPGLRHWRKPHAAARRRSAGGTSGRCSTNWVRPSSSSGNCSAPGPISCPPTSSRNW